MLVFGILIALAVTGKVFILPMIDREMMKAPMQNALMALRNGDVQALRHVFTKDATLASEETTVVVATFLETNRAFIKEMKQDNSMRFAGYTHMQRESDTRANADFTIIFHYAGADNPYPRMPFEKHGHVVLQRQGFMNWKIERISSTDPDFGEALR